MKVTKVNCLACNGSKFTVDDWVQIKYTKDNSDVIEDLRGQITYLGSKHIAIATEDWLIVPSGENTRKCESTTIDKIIWIGQGFISDYKVGTV